MSDVWALARYQVIAAYVALVPKRGERRALLEQLAARSWQGPDGEMFVVSAETLLWNPEKMAAHDPEKMAGTDPPAILRGLR